MSDLKPGFSPEIIGQNISKLVKNGTAHKHAMKIAIEHARYEFRKGSPSAPFPSHLSCVDDKVMKNPLHKKKRKKLSVVSPWKPSAKSHLIRLSAYDNSGKWRSTWELFNDDWENLKDISDMAKENKWTLKREKLANPSVRKNPVRPLKKKKRSPRPWVAKKFSGDYFVDVLSGNPQQWLPLASFIRKEKAIEYAKAYTTRTNKKTRVYKDEATKN